MRGVKLILFFALALALTNAVMAQDFNKGARTSLQFVKIGVGARQAALGEAAIATVEDVNAAFWNPAGISGIHRAEASFSYTRWFADMNYLAGAVGFRWRPINGVLALSYALLDYGEIEEALVTSAAGSGDTRTGNTVSGQDLLVGLTYSREFTDRLSIGVTAKLLQEELFDHTVTKVAFDVGTNYDVGFRGIRIGMSAQNFSGSVKYLGDESSRAEGFDIPLLFKIGVSIALVNYEDAFITLGEGQRLMLSFEVINTNDFGERYHMGGEFWLSDLIALRGGYRVNYEEGNLALGVGLQPKISNLNLRIDYAYVNYEFLDSPHRLTVTIPF